MPPPDDPPPTPEFTPPEFTPVVLRRTRPNGWTAARQQDFVAALVGLGDVAGAARSVGLSAQSAYNLRRRPGAESFAAAWETALDWASDRALDAAIGRALNGVTFARTYRGRFVGTVRRVDHREVVTALCLTGRGGGAGGGGAGGAA